VWTAGKETWTDLSTLPGLTVTTPIAPITTIATVAQSATGANLTAVGAGTTIFAVEVATSGGNNMGSLLRVVVHDQINALAVPSPSIVHYRGVSQRQLTVYAQFSDGSGSGAAHSFQDVTGLPFLRFAPAAIVDATGRVASTVANGTYTVTISLAGGLGSATTTIQLVVKDPPGQILTRVRPAKRKNSRGLLFLGEGFTDPALFMQKVNQVVGALFDSTTSPQPFARLKDSFEVWSAFTPSDSKDPGITIGVPLGNVDPTPSPKATAFVPAASAPGLLSLEEIIGRVGLAGPSAPTTLAAAQAAWPSHGVPATQITPIVFKAWQLFARVNGTAVPKETFFGASIGFRPGSIMAVNAPQDPSYSLEGTWFRPRRPIQSIVFDERRIPDPTSPATPPHLGHRAVLDAFLAQIFAAGGAPGQASRWATNGADEGLIVLLVDEDLVAGTDAPGLACSSVGSSFFVVTSPATTPNDPAWLDHAPTWQTAGSTVSLPDAFMADVIAHELGHAFGLIDEYETNPGTPSGPIAHIFDNVPNAMIEAGAQLPSNGVDASKLSWNLPRVDLSSAVTSITVDTAAQKAHVGLSAADAKLWAGRTQARLFARNGSGAPFYSAVMTATVDPSVPEVVLDVPASAGITSLSKTYADAPTLIAIRSGANASMIHDDIATWMRTNGALSKHPTGAPGPNVEIPPMMGTAALPAANKERVVAAFTGAVFVDGVLRPCGACKMRSVATDPKIGHFEPFCFICQYVIVGKVDPTLLADLDKDYPK
jgi:hypothetical protein